MSGDEQNLAQQALIERIGRLRRYVRDHIPARFRRLISADDVLQDVWIAAHPEFPALRGKDPFTIDRWLMIIAKRKLVDALLAVRRTKRGGAERFVAEAENCMTSLSILFSRLQSPQKSPSRVLGGIEAAHTVKISMAALSAERRRVIELRFVRGLTQQQIARELHITSAAVNSLLFNGLRQLRERLGEAARFLST